jgi:tRNA A-37 threonylcarbamoyl transferase component Bud32
MVALDQPLSCSNIYLIGFGLALTSEDEDDKVADLLLISESCLSS